MAIRSPEKEIISDCYSSMDISGIVQEDVRAGGIAGYMSGEIKNCVYVGNIYIYSYGEIYEGRDCFASVGLIVGTKAYAIEMEDATSNCYFSSTSILDDTHDQIINTEGTRFSEDEFLSVDWLKENLEWDETVWLFEEGKLPALR